VFFIHKTTSELKTCDLIDPIIYWCRKHDTYGLVLSVLHRWSSVQPGIGLLLVGFR
jgi:hypothetical protein